MKSLLKYQMILFACLLVSSNVYALETVTIATGEYPPFASKKLKHYGFMSQLVKEAFAKSGYEVNYKFVPWKRALESTKILKYDATSFWFITEDKQKIFHYSDPIFEEKTVFFHLKTTQLPEWKTLADLSKFRFGATRGYSYTKEFWEAGKNGLLKIEEASSDKTNFKKLLKERIDIFPSGIVVGYGILNQSFDNAMVNKLTYHHKILRSSTSHVLFPKNAPKSKKLLKAFNDGLIKLRSGGLYDKYEDDLMGGRYKK
jgi:polar amino acid transport system substrate-binding protein